MPRLPLAFAVAAVFGLASGLASAQSIAVGPLYNPATGARYYRISGGNWNQLRAFAQALGGDLCTINDAAENTWVYANLVGTTSKPYIGLNDAATEGSFVWADGATSTYRNWRSGQPSNSAAKNYVRFDGSANATWEVVTVDFSTEAIVEVGGVLRVPQEFTTVAAASNWSDAWRFGAIEVAAGVHQLGGAITLDRVTLRGAGAEQTTIAGTGSITMLPGSRIEDLTYISGTVFPLQVQGNADVAVMRCVVTGPWNPGNPLYSSSLVRASAGSSITFERCRLSNVPTIVTLEGNASAVFTNSVLRDFGYTFQSISFSSVFEVNNCVLTRLTANLPLYLPNVRLRCVNTIVSELGGTIGNPDIPPIYCLFPAAVPGPGNVIGDPLFVNSGANDFRVQRGSRAIDAGNPDFILSSGMTQFVDLGGAPRLVDVPGVPNVTGSPIDIGPFELQAASCSADLNGDGIVDDVDFVLFAVQYNAFVCP